MNRDTKRGGEKGMSDFYLSKYVEHFLLRFIQRHKTSLVNENLNGGIVP